MRILVWQWGRRGAGPRLAAAMADAMRMVPGTEALLSLSTGAEILRSRMAPACDLPFDTYGSSWGFLNRLLGTMQLTTQQFGVALTCALVLLVAWEAAKAVARRRAAAGDGVAA